jgi:lysozyme
MTIQFPDISNHNDGLVIQPGTVFVWAKASEGTYYTDPTYQGFKAQAASVGAGFGAYHFLTAGNGAAQADYCFNIVGPGVPLFVDVEPTGSSFPTTADVIAFRDRYRARGGTVEVQYYPRAYAVSQGANLASTGLLTINAEYPGSYSDNGEGWAPYCGITPFEWQWTDSFSYGGQSVDFNAYKGTLSQYLTAVGHPTVPNPPPPPPVINPEEDMFYILNVEGDTSIYALSGGRLWHISGINDLKVWRSLANVTEVTISQTELANLKASL